MGKKRKPAEITSFLGPEVHMDGVLSFSGAIRLDGRIDGSVQSEDGFIVIGEQAVVKGDVRVSRARIMGKIDGDIHAAREVALSPTGKVRGDIRCPDVVIASGAQFNGNCIMNKGRRAVAFSGAEKISASPLSPETVEEGKKN